MISFPSSRKLLLPAISLLFAALVYRLLTSSAPSASRVLIARKVLSQIPRGTLVQDDDIAKNIIPTRHPLQAHLGPPQRFYYNQNFSSQAPPRLTHLESLLTCTTKPNHHTNHIRLPNLVFNVSSTPPDAQPDGLQKFNPTVIPLPHWSPNHYLLVSRVVTSGLHQESLLCEANICHHSISPSTSSDSSVCAASETDTLGSAGGLRCATPPLIINIPPTPAERCTGAWTAFPDIPGFHDPRIFWSGNGEPLIVVNSASRYGCVGLWIVDLRTLYAPLHELLKGHDGRNEGPMMSYPHLTELTRNPRSDRNAVEKNWLLFFPDREEAYVHYDMVSHAPSNKSRSGRSFAKLIGNGYATPNLADPSEASCFEDTIDGKGKSGHWHQGSNALKLVLCTRREAKMGQCAEEEDGRSVHFAVMHRKFSNDWHLPLRYERWFVVWEGKAPFRLLAKSRFPLLFANETASGWTAAENWEGEEVPKKEEVKVQGRAWANGPFSEGNATKWLNVSDGAVTRLPLTHSNDTYHHDQRLKDQSEDSRKDNWAYFTYTPSIAWAWRPKSAETRREDRDGGAEDGSYLHSLNVGYLDDEVIVGIGLEDSAQVFAKAEVRTLLQCMELCPGVDGKSEGEHTTSRKA